MRLVLRAAAGLMGPGHHTYCSPLLQLHAYCYTRQLGTLPHAAPVDAHWPLCSFDVRGSCRDMRCSMQHLQDGRLHCGKSGGGAGGGRVPGHGEQQRGCAKASKLELRDQALAAAGPGPNSLLQAAWAAREARVTDHLRSRGEGAHISPESRMRAALEDDPVPLYNLDGEPLMLPCIIPCFLSAAVRTALLLADGQQVSLFVHLSCSAILALPAGVGVLGKAHASPKLWRSALGGVSTPKMQPWHLAHARSLAWGHLLFSSSTVGLDPAPGIWRRSAQEVRVH